MLLAAKSVKYSPPPPTFTRCLILGPTMRSCLFCHVTTLIITLVLLSPNFERQSGIDSKMVIYISQSHCPFLFLNTWRSPKQQGSITRSLCASWMSPRVLLPPASAFAHLQLLWGLLSDWTNAKLDGQTTERFFRVRPRQHRS